MIYLSLVLSKAVADAVKHEDRSMLKYVLTILGNSEIYISYGLEDYWFPIILKWLNSEDQYLSDACLKYKKVFEKAI